MTGNEALLTFALIAGGFLLGGNRVGVFLCDARVEFHGKLGELLAFRLALGLDFVHEADEAVVAVVRFRDELLEHLLARTLRRGDALASGGERDAGGGGDVFVDVALDDAHALDFRLQRLGLRANAEALDKERRDRFAKRDARHDQDKRHTVDREAGYDLARNARRGRGCLGGGAQEGAGHGDEKRSEQRARGGALLAGGKLLGCDPGEDDEQKALGNCHKAREEVVRREGSERIHVEEHAHGRIVEARIGQRQHEQQRRTRDLVHGLLLHLGVLDDRALALGRALWGDARQTLLGLDDLAANSRTVG